MLKFFIVKKELMISMDFLKEVKEVRDNNPDGPYKKILREEKGISI